MKEGFSKRFVVISKYINSTFSKETFNISRNFTLFLIKKKTTKLSKKKRKRGRDNYICENIDSAKRKGKHVLNCNMCA